MVRRQRERGERGSARVGWVAALLASAGATACSSAESRALGTETGANRAAARTSRPPYERIDEPSAQACGACHSEALAEWTLSLHHGAWTNPNARAATHDFTKTECRACHSPMPVLLASSDGVPDYRGFLQEDGVHCLSCHGLEDGVAAARTIPEAPCKPRFEPRLVRADFCANCHQPEHGVFDEYLASDAHAVGIRCVDCHMPQRGDGPGRSHGPNGGYNADFVRRSVDFRCALDGSEVVVSLRNRTGHRLPGEIPSRALIVRVVGGDGAVQSVVLRRPHPDGPEQADPRLEVDEERELRFAFTGAGIQEVRLEWKPTATTSDSEATLLQRWTPTDGYQAANGASESSTE